MNALVAYAQASGPTFWLIVLAVALTIEVINGRGWAAWAAGGACVAAALTAWLKLDPAIAGLAFIAATGLGVGYAIRARSLSAAAKLRPPA